MRNIPDLNLVFLWRKLWHELLLQKIAKAGMEDRVEIHNQKVDVNGVLTSCHASTVLAANEKLVKAWPHSAIESLAAGKPVLLSRSIPMAEFVTANRAGVSVDSLKADDVVAGINQLREVEWNGNEISALARAHFDPGRMVQQYSALYE